MYKGFTFKSEDNSKSDLLLIISFEINFIVYLIVHFLIFYSKYSSQILLQCKEDCETLCPVGKNFEKLF